MERSLYQITQSVLFNSENKQNSIYEVEHRPFSISEFALTLVSSPMRMCCPGMSC
jgi:hypothetical protein